MMETIMRWADQLRHQVRALRYFNVAGAAKPDGSTRGEDHGPETPSLADRLGALQGKRERFIFGDDYQTIDGTNVRDYVHPFDLADAHLLAEYLRNGNPSTAFNLGSRPVSPPFKSLKRPAR